MTRQQMIERDLYGRGIHDARVLAAMAAVPREAFVPSSPSPPTTTAPLPIAAGQTISQPYIAR